MPSAFASIKAGAQCSLAQYNSDARLKSGGTTFACVGAPDGYYWEPLGSGGSSAHVANTPPKSPFYLRGFNAISNSTQEGLVTYGYYSYLNAQNVMTSTNAIRWCSYVAQLIHLRTNAMDSWTPANLKDWKSGCASAAVGNPS